MHPLRFPFWNDELILTATGNTVSRKPLGVDNQLTTPARALWEFLDRREPFAISQGTLHLETNQDGDIKGQDPLPQLTAMLKSQSAFQGSIWRLHHSPASPPAHSCFLSSSPWCLIPSALPANLWHANLPLGVSLSILFIPRKQTALLIVPTVRLSLLHVCVFNVRIYKNLCM